MYLITFQTGSGNRTHIKYILVRKREQWACIDYNVFPDEDCALQHRLKQVNIGNYDIVLNFLVKP